MLSMEKLKYMLIVIIIVVLVKQSLGNKCINQSLLCECNVLDNRVECLKINNNKVVNLILNSSIEIKSLNLSFNNLNYNDIKYMLNDVKLSSSLTSLNLSNNKLFLVGEN